MRCLPVFALTTFLLISDSSSQERLQFDMCENLFGSGSVTCRPNCTRFYVHRWGINLCSDPEERCCDTTMVTQATEQSVTTTSARNTDANGNRTNPGNPSATSALSPAGSTSTNGTAVPAILATPYPDCGVSKTVIRRKRVVGGSRSPKGSWPWLATIRSAFGPIICGATILSRRWVLTAAHCFKFSSITMLWRVRIGEHNRQIPEEERDVAISRIIKHPEYVERTRLQENRTEEMPLSQRYGRDLALVKLHEDLDLSRADAGAVCLPDRKMESHDVEDFDGGTVDSGLDADGRAVVADDNIETTGNCQVAGWGVREDQVPDPVLNHVHLNHVSTAECSRLYNSSHLGDDVLCFGNGTLGACHGDSGNALTCQYNGRHYIVGVVSWGTYSCLPGYPSVFTRVGSYLNWINDTMNEI